MPRRLCLALMALTQCFKTEIVNSKAKASQMKAHNASVLIGSKSLSTSFQTAQVSTVRRCVAYFLLVPPIVYPDAQSGRQRAYDRV